MRKNPKPERVLSRMTHLDLDDVIALERHCFPDPWPRDLIEVEIDEADDQRFPVVARVDGILVGYMIAWFIADEAHLGNLAVAPAAQRTGLASALLEALVAEARLRGSAHIVLEVRAGNSGAIRLYERHGFDAVAVRKEYYEDDKEDAVIMMRLL